MATTKKIDVLKLALETSDAYSCSRYGSKAWTQSIKMLAERGYTESQIEAILRSKWMRWAADHGKNRYPTSEDVARFLDDPRNQCTMRNVKRLVAETL